MKETSRQQIDRNAKLFSWESYGGLLREVIYLRGDYRVHVHYSVRGAVVAAERYHAMSLAPGKSVLLGSTDGLSYKRTTVISWLAED